MSFIGATGLDEVQEQFDILNEKIDANADYINNLVGIPDPTHTAVFGINILNPGLFGLVERAEVNIAALQTGEEGLTTDITGLTTQVEGIQGEITGIQGEITTIQGEITGIEGEISLIQFTELPAIVSSISAVAGVAGDALIKANKSLGIWDEDGNNTYNMKSGNVAIGILPKGTLLNNKLEVNGSINIPTNSKYKINNVPLSYSDLAGTPPVSSKWTNATDVATNIYYSTGNVGIGVTSAINNKLEVGGNINIPTGSKYKINNVDLSYNDLTNKLTAGTNISIVANAINNTLTAGTNISIVSGAINNTYTYTLPTAGVGTGGTLGGVKVDGSTINITNGIISAVSTASGASISLDGSTNNRSYGWTGSTSLLGRVGVAGNYSTGSAVEDVVLRSQGKLILQSGTTNPAMVIDTTNNTFLRNAVGIGTDTISAGNMLDVGGTFKIAYSSGAERLTITSTGVQVNNTLNVSSGFNSGGLIRFGGFSDDSSFDLATIQNREYATNKSELLLFKGDNIEGLTGVDRIRLRAGAIAFDTFATDATTSATTENIRMFINGNGDVGIGTTQPTAELDIVGVNSGFGTTLDMLNMRYDASWGLKFVQNLTIAGNIIYNIVHRYNAVNNTLMTFSNANVGIGTTSPETTFDINGNLLLRAYEAGTGGTKGVFFRTGFTSTNQYNCSILAYDHNAVSAANGLSINGFGGISFCTGANTRQEIMRISQGGNVGIGTTIPFSTPQRTMKLDVNGNVYAGNNSYFLSGHDQTASSQFFGKQYLSTILAGMEIENTTLVGNYSQKLHFHTHHFGTSSGRRMTINENGSISMTGQLTLPSVITSGGLYQRSIYEALLYTDSIGMFLCFGNIGDGTNANYLKISAAYSHTLYESNNQRSHKFYVYQNTFSGISSVWQFVYGGASYNGLNSQLWNVACDHRIKENIVKADLKTCYDNIKNINLYRYNYIDIFETSSKDKNKLGYIAQEVKKHFPKAIHTQNTTLKDKREIPDLLTIDAEQINLTLYGAVKQLIKVVEKQSKRIKALEILLNIEENDDVENDAGQPYERIYDENEIDIDTIEPTEPSNEV